MKSNITIEKSVNGINDYVPKLKSYEDDVIKELESRDQRVLGILTNIYKNYKNQLINYFKSPKFKGETNINPNFIKYIVYLVQNYRK